MKSTTKPSVLLIGAGAVGSYFAGRCAAAGKIELTAVFRHDTEAVRRDGIRAESIAGDFTVRPRIVAAASEYGKEPDWIILATKVLPEIDPVALIGEALGPKTGILLIQNGLGIEEPIAQAFPGHPLLSAVAYIGVSRTETPGVVRHIGSGRLKLGDYPGGGAPDALAMWTRIFTASGVPVTAERDIVRARWFKLLWNIPYNGISVVGGRVGTKRMVEDPELAELAERLMKEIQAVAASEGRILTDREIQDNIDYTRNFPDYKTSMLLDFEARRPLECQAIVGNALAAARKNGVPAPTLQALFALLASCDRENRC